MSGIVTVIRNSIRLGLKLRRTGDSAPELRRLFLAAQLLRHEAVARVTLLTSVVVTGVGIGFGSTALRRTA